MQIHCWKRHSRAVYFADLFCWYKASRSTSSHCTWHIASSHIIHPQEWKAIIQFKKTCDEEYFPIEMILYKYFLKENIIHKWFIFHQSSIKSSSYKSIANILFLWVPCHDSQAEKNFVNSKKLRLGACAIAVGAGALYHDRFDAVFKRIFEWIV